MMNANAEKLDVFDDLVDEFNELNSLVSSVEVMSDSKLYNHYVKRMKQIQSVALPMIKYRQLLEDEREFLSLYDLEENLHIKNEIKCQIEEIRQHMRRFISEAKTAYSKNKLLETENVFVEITTKTDEELAVYLLDLFINYLKINKFDYKVEKSEIMSKAFYAEGFGVYEILNVFAGKIKKVQFGAESFANVVVIKNIKQIDDIKEDDLIIQTSKSSGAGGQHINKTESAVRIIHQPTGIVAECQDERSQTKNKEKAIQRLKEKITQINLKNQKNNEEKQRHIIKNKLFGSTPTVIVNFDENKVIFTEIRKEYKIKEIDEKLDIIFSDINE